MNVEMQAVKVSKTQELEAERINRAKQLAMLDLVDKRHNQGQGSRQSMAFQNSSRLSKIGPFLHSKPDEKNSGESRFSVINSIISAD
jgi:hypothetical protein